MNNELLMNILEEVKKETEKIKIELTLEEHIAIDKVLYEVAGEYQKIRDQDPDCKNLTVEQALFIDAIISASNKINSIPN